MNKFAVAGFLKKKKKKRQDRGIPSLRIPLLREQVDPVSHLHHLEKLDSRCAVNLSAPSSLSHLSEGALHAQHVEERTDTFLTSDGLPNVSMFVVRSRRYVARESSLPFKF